LLAAVWWGGLAAASLLIGYVLANRGLGNLTMLADAMMPEAFEHGGKAVGLFTVAGFALAAVLSVMQ
jgi:ZIP family zinc transporter